MSKLIWNQEGQNLYEYGVDRGVLYLPTTTELYGRGVVWNGLVNVEESNVGGDVSSYHFDGIKYLDITSPKNYQATISAYDIPYDFMKILGDYHIIPGVILTRQARSRFGLSYRTFFGGTDGYKLHIVYHVLAKKNKHLSATLIKNSVPGVSSWTMSAVPVSSSEFRPSAHFILDSTVVEDDRLQILEAILYGTDRSEARLPTIDELLTFVWNLESLVIISDEINGLADLEAGIGDLYKTKDDGLNRALPDTRLKEIEISGLYRLEEA